MIIAEGMIIDHQRSMIMTWGYEHWSLWSLIMLIHTWMCCSYYDRLLIMGDDMLIIAMNRLVIMHDQRHIHVIMNIIVNPSRNHWKWLAPFPQATWSKKNDFFAIFHKHQHTQGLWKIVKNQSHLAKFGCGNGAILVIFSDFGLGQPKRHFFDTFLQFWPWRGPKRDKTHL